MDKSSYPARTLEPCVDIPEWHDKSFTEGRGDFLSNHQVHTAYSDSIHNMHYLQDVDTTPPLQEASHFAARGPVLGSNKTLIVSGYRSLVAMFRSVPYGNNKLDQYLPSDMI